MHTGTSAQQTITTSEFKNNRIIFIVLSEGLWGMFDEEAAHNLKHTTRCTLSGVDGSVLHRELEVIIETMC